MKKTVIRLTLALLLIIFLVFFASKEVDFKKVLELIGDISKPLAALLLLISFSMAFLKGIRMYLLLLQNGIKISLWQGTKVYMAGQATSPLPGGEAMRGVLTEVETGTPLIKTSGPIVTQAFLELLSASVLAILGSIYFNTLKGPALAMLLILIFITTLLLNRQLLNKFVDLIKRLPLISQVGPKLIQIQDSIQESILHKNSFRPNRAFIFSLLIAILTHIMGGLIIYLTARSFGLDLSWLRSIFIYTCGIVITALTGIVPGGLGFTEGGLTGILLLSKVSPDKAIAVVLVLRLTTLIFYILLGLLFTAIFYSRYLFKSSRK